MGVQSPSDSLDFALFRHPAEQHLQGVALHAGLFHEGRNRHGQACLFERGNDLGPLRRDVNLGRVAEQAPAARLLVELNRKLCRFHIAATDVEDSAIGLVRHDQDGIYGAGHAK